MVTRDVPFSDFALSETRLINQALRFTLGRVNTESTIFYAYGERADVPTKAEANLAAEVIGYALDNQVIAYGTEQFITDALRFVAWHIDNWVEGRPEGQTEEWAIQEYVDKFGVDIDKNTADKLRHLAKSICPQAEIYLSCTASVLPSDGCLDGCKKALEQLLAPAPMGSPDYRAHLGIVVNGILYNIPRIHPVVDKLKKAIEEYQDHAYAVGEWLEDKVI